MQRQKVRTVLIVSDDASTVVELKRIMGATDAAVVLAKTPNEARSVMSSLSPDKPMALVLLDVVLSNVDGPRLVEELRTNSHGTPRIVLLSSFSPQTLESMRRLWSADESLATNRGLLHMTAALRGWLGATDAPPLSRRSQRPT